MQKLSSVQPLPPKTKESCLEFGVFMPLIIKEFSPKGGEIKVLKHLTEIYELVPYDVYLYHDLLMSVDSKTHFRPDFVILDPKCGIAIIEVKSYKRENIENWDQFEVQFKNGNSDTNPFKKGQEYQFKLENYLGSKEISKDAFSIKSHLVFPYLKEKDTMAKEQPFVDSHFTDFNYTLNLGSLFKNKEIHPPVLKALKLALNPVFNFKLPTNGNIHSDRTSIHELDQTQYKIAEKELKGHYLVKGIPGSGKSIAVVSRAIYTLQNEPSWKILVLCENTKLKNKNLREIEERIKGIEEFGYDSNHIEVKTLMSFLRDLNSEKNYRHMRYPEEMAQHLFDLQESSPSPIWDSILIDEYQDFTDEQLKFIKSMAKAKSVIINNKEVMSENLFLAGDSLQQIKEQGCSNSWNEIGINIIGRGRSESLKSSYRCGQEILDISLKFLKSSSKTMEKEVDKYYEGTEELEHLRPGENHFQTNEKWWSDSFTELNHWIQNLVDSGASYRDFIIITPNNRKHQEQITRAFAKEVAQGLTVGMPSNIKGLEASYCAILNFGWIGNYDKRIDNKYKKIYMCLTRASEGVFINCCKGENNEYVTLVNLIDTKTIKKTG